MPDVKTAEKVAAEIRLRIARGEFQLPDKKDQIPTLAEYYGTYTEVYLTTAVKLTTLATYDCSFTRHILPKLGHLRLDQITRLDVEKFIAQLIRDKKLSRSSIRIVMSCLTACLNHAIEHDIITRNPTYKTAKLYRHAPTRTKEIQPLNEGEVRRFLEAAIKHHRNYYELFLCAIHTGMRSAELAGLQWDDVDSEGKYIVVKRQVVWGQIETTKANKVRRIDLSSALLEALRELKRRRREEYFVSGKNRIPEWIFSNGNGDPLDMHNVKNRHFYPCLEKAGLRRIRFHDLRHSFATILIQNGEPIAYVQKQLGHSSIKLTVDTYTHWMPGKNREAMDRLPVLATKVH
jgi:integrase